eukprot:3644581-Rhodomonas_salina.1
MEHEALAPVLLPLRDRCPRRQTHGRHASLAVVGCSLLHQCGGRAKDLLDLAAAQEPLPRLLVLQRRLVLGPDLRLELQ